MSIERRINFLRPVVYTGLFFLTSGSSVLAQEYPESSLKVDMDCELHSLNGEELVKRHLDIGIVVENNPVGTIPGQISLRYSGEEYIIGIMNPGASHFVNVLHGEYFPGLPIRQNEVHTIRADFSDGTSLEAVFMTPRCL